MKTCFELLKTKSFLKQEKPHDSNSHKQNKDKSLLTEAIAESSKINSKEKIYFQLLIILFLNFLFMINFLKALGPKLILFISLVFFLLDFIPIFYILYFLSRKKVIVYTQISKITLLRGIWLLIHALFSIFICLFIEEENTKLFFTKFLFLLILIKNLIYLVIRGNNALICTLANLGILLVLIILKVLSTDGIVESAIDKKK